MFRNPLSLVRDRRRDEDGFTLIELLVVVVILGILIGIAIPVYLNYRKSANDKAAQSDLRGAVSTLEVCNSESGYPTSLTADFGSSSTGGNATLGGTCTQTVPVSAGTQMKYTLASGAYTIFARNANGSGSATDGRYYCYSSAAGGSVKSVTGSYTGATSC